jgi:hypothetical protein
MESEYNRILREIEEEVDGYNDSLLDVIAQDLENLADNLSDEYYFTSDVRGGDAAQDVYDWVRENKPDVLRVWLDDLERVAGHDVVWQALESMKKVEPWNSFDEEDALGMDVRDYEAWKSSQRTEESVCEGLDDMFGVLG